MAVRTSVKGPDPKGMRKESHKAGQEKELFSRVGIFGVPYRWLWNPCCYWPATEKKRPSHSALAFAWANQSRNQSTGVYQMVSIFQLIWSHRDYISKPTDIILLLLGRTDSFKDSLLMPGSCWSMPPQSFTSNFLPAHFWPLPSLLNAHSPMYPVLSSCFFLSLPHPSSLSSFHKLNQSRHFSSWHCFGKSLSLCSRPLAICVTLGSLEGALNSHIGLSRSCSLLPDFVSPQDYLWFCYVFSKTNQSS